MATLGSKLLVKEMEWNANMTEQSHLGAALIAKPHRIMGEMDKLFSAQNYYSDNPMSSLLMGNSKTEETIGNTEWEWELKGANTRPLVVVENVENAENSVENIPVEITAPTTLKVAKISKHQAGKKTFKHVYNLSYGEKKHAEYLENLNAESVE